MTKQVRRRRGTAIEHNTFTGALGETTVVSDDSSLRVHDGVLPGGHPAIAGGSLPWTPRTYVSHAAQAFTTGAVTTDDYQSWLADPALLPFTTSATFAEDAALGRWAAVNVTTREWSLEHLNLQSDYEDPTTKSSGWTELEPPVVTAMKESSAISVDTDGATINRKPIKAWNYPRGIKDSAVAAAFMLTGIDSSEPDAQVTGHSNIDDVGKYPGHDAVAVFAQVDSADTFGSSTNTTYTSTSVTSPDFIPIFDQIDEGMFVDTLFGMSGWTGSAVVGKVAPSTLLIKSWRKMDGTSDLADTPVAGDRVAIDLHNNIWAANFNAIINETESSGIKQANQAIGIETGLACNRAGTGTNSKAYYAVNLWGEDPEFGYTATGGFQKMFNSQGATVAGFKSNRDKIGLTVANSGGNSIESDNPTGHHLECRNSSNHSQVIITNDSKVLIGKDVESGRARVSVRGAGVNSAAYDETEFAIYDPTVALVDRQGFYIAHTFPASVPLGTVTVGVGSTGTHTYQMDLATANTTRMRLRPDGSIEGGRLADGAADPHSFGTAARPWDQFFANNTVISTSDERLKTFGSAFSDAEKRVAVKVKALLTNFKWNESIERESNGGKKARVHIGIGAQSLGEAFTSEGLNPNDYSMFCYDEWEEETVSTQTNIGEVVVTPVVTIEPVTEVKSVTEWVTAHAMIDGKYTKTRTSTTTDKIVPVYDYHTVHDEKGAIIYDVTTVKGVKESKPRIATVQRTKEVTTMVESPAEAVYETVVVPASNKYGVKLDHVLAFIIANT